MPEQWRSRRGGRVRVTTPTLRPVRRRTYILLSSFEREVLNLATFQTSSRHSKHVNLLLAYICY